MRGKERSAEQNTRYEALRAIRKPMATAKRRPERKEIRITLANENKQDRDTQIRLTVVEVVQAERA